MTDQQNPQKRGHQVRRAWRLIAALDAWFLDQGFDTDPETVLGVAEHLPHATWVEFAQTHSTGFDRRPPSPETVAMAVEMLRSRKAADDEFHRRTHGNMRLLGVK